MTTTTKANEKPILFSTPLVQAILEGRKTQTRRVVKPQPEIPEWHEDENGAHKMLNAQYFLEEFTWMMGAPWGAQPCSAYDTPKCPYGKPGEELWVRETWQALQYGSYEPFECKPSEIPEQYAETRYKASECSDWPWKPSIHMPRWVSRIQLTVTNVRVERVQDISEDDAKAEGYNNQFIEPEPFQDTYAKVFGHSTLAWFEQVWDSINARPKPVKSGGQIMHYESFPWENITETREHRGKPWYVYGNPWVWCVSFEVKEVKGGSHAN